MLVPGSDFRGLKIQNRLAAGGMGDTWLASHPILKTLFVVKRLRIRDAAALNKEARLAARMTSPYVVPILDAGVEHGEPYLIQHYVDGVDLAMVVQAFASQKRRLPVGIVSTILSQVAQALHHAHQVGVVHRDVKPQNVFLNGKGSALLGDFGLALDIETADSGGGQGGTPSYKSPEQWRGEATGRFTDLYALGATAHFMLTGIPPFSEQTTEGIRQAHLEKTYQPPEVTSPRESFLFKLIQLMLAKEPEKRPRQADGVARMFDSLSVDTVTYMLTGNDDCLFGDLQLTLAKGDAATFSTDVLVRSISSQDDDGLLAKAGAKVKEGVGDWERVPLGSVLWTDGGALAAARLAHTAEVADGALCLQRCMLATLLRAEMDGIRHVTFQPMGGEDISLELVAQGMLETVVTFSSWRPRWVRRLTVLVPDDQLLMMWRDYLRSFATNPLETLLSGMER